MLGECLAEMFQCGIDFQGLRFAAIIGGNSAVNLARPGFRDLGINRPSANQTLLQLIGDKFPVFRGQRQDLFQQVSMNEHIFDPLPRWFDSVWQGRLELSRSFVASAVLASYVTSADSRNIPHCNC